MQQQSKICPKDPKIVEKCSNPSFRTKTWPVQNGSSLAAKSEIGKETKNQLVLGSEQLMKQVFLYSLIRTNESEKLFLDASQRSKKGVF